MNWLSILDDRQQKEIAFARVYAENFHHGTDGHSRLMLIAGLADMLDAVTSRVGDGITSADLLTPKTSK